MRTATVEVNIPAELLAYGFQPADIQQHVTEWLVLTLFKDGHVSSGKAASLLAIPRVEFLALLRRRGIAYVDYSPEEVEDEINAVKQLSIEPSQ